MSPSPFSFPSSLTSPKYRSERLTLTIYFKLLVLLWLLTLLPIPFTAALLTSKTRRQALALHGISIGVLTLITIGCVLYYYYSEVGIELEDLEDRRQIENGEAKLEWGMQIIFEESEGSWRKGGKERNVRLVPLVKVPERVWVDGRGRMC